MHSAIKNLIEIELEAFDFICLVLEGLGGVDKLGVHVCQRQSVLRGVRQSSR